MPQIVFRLVRTRGLRPDWPTIRRHAEKALDKEVKPALVKKLSAVAKGWKHAVTFDSSRKRTPTESSVYVYPAANKRIWGFVTLGTKGGYLIPTSPPARGRDGLLHYQVDYSARTAPGGQYGLGTGQKSGKWVTPGQVTHPGIEKPREFEKRIAKDYTPEFRRVMENAMRRGIRAAQKK